MNNYAWYGKQAELDSAAFGALALIEPIIDKVNLADIINQHLPVDPQAEYQHGDILSLLVAARLYSPIALSNVQTWAEQSGADVLFGIPAEKLNDDRLGRSLDAFFEQRHSILASLALQAAETFNIPLDRLHYDPTHILFTGAYEGAEARDESPDSDEKIDQSLPAANITKGKATDDAPRGARMVHAGVTTYIDELGPLPLFGHVISGNQNGRTGIRQQLALITKLLKPTKFTMLSDRGTFSVAHLLRLCDANSHAICSVPWADVKTLFADKRAELKWKPASYLSIEQQRRRDRNSTLAREHYEIAVQSHTFTDKESGRSIKTRVLFVYSSADAKIVRERRDKRISRVQAELAQIEKSVAAGRYNTKIEAAKKRIGKVLGDRNMDRYFEWDLKPLSTAEQARLTKSKVRGGRVPTHRLSWSFDAEVVQSDQQDDGYSAIATTVPTNQKSADEVFTMLREQNLVEHANAQFKGKLAVRPVFLHNAKRVEALVFLLMVALMLYFLLQRRYRENTPSSAPEKERRTTASTLLKAFMNYSLVLETTAIGVKVRPTRLTSQQRAILSRLGFPTPAQTLSRRLPRPPD